MKSVTPWIASFLATLVWGVSSFGEDSNPKSKWKLGAPIVTYWAGPGSHTPLNDVTASQLASGGWNLGWTKRAEDLDLYDRHGLRAVLEIGMPDLDDPAQAEALDALIVKVRDHPALYSYYLADEPGAGAFAKLGKIVSWIRRRDPAHMAFICLLPTYASDGQLQVSDDVAERARVGYPQDFAGVHTSDLTAVRYREHLRQFVDVVRPDLISYDHYHFQHSGDGTQYFLNLALIRSTALAADVPFLNVIQACESVGEGLRLPDAQELRWLTYTSIAYGAQGLAHFRYDTGFWKAPRETSVPLPRFWAVSQLNREFVAVATQLQPLRSIGAYHSDKAPLGGAPLPVGSAFTPEASSQDWLLGYFGSSTENPTHVMVVNLDYKAKSRVTLNGPGGMEAFHAPTGVWRPLPGGGRIELDLPPGDGVLIRLSR